MSIALFTLSIIILALCGEIVRHFVSARDVSRKFVHVGTGILYLSASYYMSGSDIVLASVIAALGLLITRKFKFFPGVHVVKRSSYGEIYYPLGIALAAIVALPEHADAFRFSVCILAFADATAALVGIHVGKIWYRIMHNRKTLEGSLAFLLVSIVLAIVFQGELTLRMFMGAVALMVVEGMLVFGLDNLALPPLAALMYITVVG